MLYGLKQLIRHLNKRFDTFMLGHDYFRSDYDSYVYFKTQLDGLFLYLLLYIYDILITYKNMFEINSLNDQLR